MTQKEKIEAELRTIKKAKGGLLMPEDVVEYARSEETALHAQFTWDDTEAARKYRLDEARSVIRVHVQILDNGDELPRYVHLPNDRAGYREMEEVLADPQLTQTLMRQALRDLRSMQQKYAKLEALRPLWKAFEKIEQETAIPVEQ